MFCYGWMNLLKCSWIDLIEIIFHVKAFNGYRFSNGGKICWFSFQLFVSFQCICSKVEGWTKQVLWMCHFGLFSDFFFFFFLQTNRLMEKIIGRFIHSENNHQWQYRTNGSKWAPFRPTTAVKSCFYIHGWVIIF